MNIGIIKGKMIWVITFFLLLGVFLIISSYSILNLFDLTTIEKEGMKHEYRYLKVNFEENTNSRGFASIQKILKKDQFMSYEDPDGNNVLISNIGTDEYECLGMCSCVDEKNRRVAGSSVLISQSIRFLVAAVSSTIAYKKAKEYLKGECGKRLEDQCTIRSEEIIIGGDGKGDEDTIDMGENIQAAPWADFEYKVSECGKYVYKDKPPRKKDGEVRDYVCSGYCLVRRDLPSEELLQLALDFGCETTKNEGKVTVEGYGVQTDWQGIAHQDFQENQMKPFCKKVSKIRNEYPAPGIFRNYYLCSGVWFESNNPTIECIDTRIP